MGKTAYTLTPEKIFNDPYGFTYEDISSCLCEADARTLFSQLYHERKTSKYQTMTISHIYRSSDTVKYVFGLKDGYAIETVCIKRKTGVTVCISTMVGCPVRCVFCASGSNGFIRNLTPGEIVQQVILLEERINRIVFMGMGEPLLNYDSVIKSIHVMRDRNGLNFPTDGITISTVGPIPQLKKLREEHIKIQLTLSLHATTQKERDTLIPSMRNYGIESVIESVLSYSERHNRKVTIAYLVIPGLNDGESDAERLAYWFYGQNVLINLLQYNETENFHMNRPSKKQLVIFKTMLEHEGLDVILRESHGSKIGAACGQLVSSKNKREPIKKERG